MKIEELIDKGDTTSVLIQQALNILLESPYFYKTDDVKIFALVWRYRQAFNAFFEKFFGWHLVIDEKCARLCKEKWYNEAITPVNRDMFNFTKRDECVAFLLLLEFFERESREQEVTVEMSENLKIKFGDWLEYSAKRFRELFPTKHENYTDEAVRKILREVMPVLEKYRFLDKKKPPQDEKISEAETIYECLPALWHYQAEHLLTPFDKE